MIAKNVGIRRAYGRFVLATNIDIVFSNELVEYLASGRLEPGCLYRVDRHDIQNNLPVDAPLDVQMAYCAEHHLRIHARWGSYAVDGLGRALPMSEDIVDGKTVRLGSGWHVREGTSATGFCRWVTDRAVIHVDCSADRTLTPAVLEIETQANPYTPSSWVDLEIADESGAVLARHRVTRRRTWRLPLEGGGDLRTFELRVAAVPAGSRRHLAVFERRDAMRYQVRSIRVTNVDEARTRPSLVYPAFHWRAVSGAVVDLGRLETVSVTTGPRRGGYAAEYGPMWAPETGAYRFTLTCDVVEGGIAVGVLDYRSGGWLPAVVDEVLTPSGHVTSMDVQLAAGTTFSLMVSNDHLDEEGVSRFVIKKLAGSTDPQRLLRVRRREAAAAAQQGPLDPPPRVEHQSIFEAWIERRMRRKEMAARTALVFSLDGWHPADFVDIPELERLDDGLAVVSRGARWHYCIEHGLFRAPVAGTYHFAIDYRLIEGGILGGLLNEGKGQWLRSSSREQVNDDHRTLTISAALKAGQACWLVLSNDHDAGGVSRFVVADLRGSVQPADRFARLLEFTQGRGAYWRGHEVRAIRNGSELPPDVWRIADASNNTRIDRGTDGLLVDTPSSRGAYALVAGPLRAKASGTYRFSLSCDVSAGGIALGVLDRDKTRWLPSRSDRPATCGHHTLTISVDVAKAQLFWLIVSNSHPEADRPSRFEVRGLTATVEPRIRPFAGLSASERWRIRASRSRARMGLLRARIGGLARRGAYNSMPAVVLRLVDRARARIVHRSPEYGALLTVYHGLARDLARMSELGELAQLHKLLQEYRPDELHLNACGDFQLMAREHWFELCGYPEFETFSMNIDGLLSSIATCGRNRRACARFAVSHLPPRARGRIWLDAGRRGAAAPANRRARHHLARLERRLRLGRLHALARAPDDLQRRSDWGFGAVELEESTIDPGVVRA